MERNTVCFLVIFGAHPMGLKRVRETTLSLSCAGETQQRQVYSRYRLIPHGEVELTPLFNDHDLRYVISKQLGGNGRKFIQVMVPAESSDSIEMEIPL